MYGVYEQLVAIVCILLPHLPPNYILSNTLYILFLLKKLKKNSFWIGAKFESNIKPKLVSASVPRAVLQPIDRETNF